MQQTNDFQLPTNGQKYFLGEFHKKGGSKNKSEKVYAFYLGETKNRYRFYRENNGAIQQYSCIKTKYPNLKNNNNQNEQIIFTLIRYDGKTKRAVEIEYLKKTIQKLEDRLKSV